LEVETETVRGKTATLRQWNTAVSCSFIGLMYVITGGAQVASASVPRPLLLAQRTVRSSQQTASIHWGQVPLRDAVARASGVFGEAILVDRRIDPTRRVTLHVDSVTLDELLQSLAASHALGTSRLGQLRYLGPSSAAAQLRTVAVVRGDEVSTLPTALAASLERAERLTWPRLTDPRKLISSVAIQRGWRIARAERIPHDLWPAGSLPPLSATEQLTALLIGFHLTFKVNAITRTLEIVSLEPVSIERRYSLVGRQRNKVALLQRELPPGVVRVAGNSVVVEGRVEEHERVYELLEGVSKSLSQSLTGTGRGDLQPPVQSTKQVYTLRVEEQPVGVILRQLAERLQWTIEIDNAAIEAAGLSLEMRISFAVEKCSQEELLEAVLQPAGLDFRTDGDRIRIVPAAQ
jgi:hypothetical protein